MHVPGEVREPLRIGSDAIVLPGESWATAGREEPITGQAIGVWHIDVFHPEQAASRDDAGLRSQFDKEGAEKRDGPRARKRDGQRGKSPAGTPRTHASEAIAAVEHARVYDRFASSIPLSGDFAVLRGEHSLACASGSSSLLAPRAQPLLPELKAFVRGEEGGVRTITAGGDGSRPGRRARAARPRRERAPGCSARSGPCRTGS